MWSSCSEFHSPSDLGGASSPGHSALSGSLLDRLETLKALQLSLFELLLDLSLLSEGFLGELRGVVGDAGAHARVVDASLVLDRADLDLALLFGSGDTLGDAAHVVALFGYAAFADKVDLF